MRKVYSALARLVAVGVVVQAAVIALAFGGVLNSTTNGDVVDKALIESREGGGEIAIGLNIHETMGWIVIPALAVALFVLSFFVRARGAKLWAVIVVVLVLLQSYMGAAVAGLPFVGLIHGANALAIVAMAGVASRVVGRERDSDAADASAAPASSTEGTASDAVTA